MKREEYLKRLESALHFLPGDTRVAALDFYAEMIDDRMEDGLDELSAVAAMEAPEDIADRLRAENPAEQAPETSREAGESARNAPPMQDEAMEFSALAEQVRRSISHLVNAGKEQAERVVADAEREVEKAEREMEKAEREMNRRESHYRADDPDGEYMRKFTCPAEGVRAVKLIVRDMPIEIVPCQGEEMILTYYTSARNPYTVTLDDGVLTLRNPDQGWSRGGFSLDRLGIHILISWSRSTPTIRLEMPSAVLVDLLAHTSNGSVKAGGFSSLCDVDLETSNSRIVLERVNCKTLDLKSSNGRLELRGVQCKQIIRGKTSNARIEADNVRGGGPVTLHTSNGRIKAEQVICRSPLELKTSNGSITVSGVDAPQVTLKTSNGSISGVLPGPQAAWAIDSGTSNAHNSLPSTQPGGKPLSVHTSNGSISLGFQGSSEIPSIL